MQLMSTKRMHEKVYLSNPLLYKHVLRENLAEFPTWDDMDYLAPGVNDVGESRGATMATHEYHERKFSLGIKESMPQVSMSTGTPLYN